MVWQMAVRDPHLLRLGHFLRHLEGAEESTRLGLFFFIFISTPEGHERGTFWRIIISFQSGTENID